ncbi:hypothetical protein ACIQXI_14310 [Lysinibacillus sp. NPDC097195]|uniref:hypothetical protein n=1 Tax=Lysinibacillus sp. NPDC097195 TaxID=3364141 RepID=UPI0037F25E87
MKVLTRKQSGSLAESLVFSKLVSLGHTVRFATVNQAGYDLQLLNPHKKIEVKHIQRVGDSKRDMFILKSSQAKVNAFDNLVLVISDCTTPKGITNFEYYIFSNQEIQNLIQSKSTSTGNYTLNLTKDGLSICKTTQLIGFKDQWGKI